MMIVTVGGTYGEMPTVSRAGYSFLGWYTDTSWTTKISMGSKVTTVGNHTLYARWQIK